MIERQIVSVDEMRQLDKLTLDNLNITSFELMYQAGTVCFRHLFNNGIISFSDSILIIAGTGNNGGDSLVIGHHLIEAGMSPTFLIIGEADKQTLESKEIVNKIKSKDFLINRCQSESDLEEAMDIINSSSLIIEGIFGIGLSKTVTSYQEVIIDMINDSYAKKVSIDIPSGISAYNGLVMGTAIKADYTCVIQNYKQGNLLNDALDFSGKMILLDIGILQNIFPEKHELLQLAHIKNKIIKRKHNTYKYSYGDVVTIGGNKGMMGAPIMAAYSALRTGSGLSRVFFNEKTIKYIQNPYPELMIDTFTCVEDIHTMTLKKSAIIFGPGLGRVNPEYEEILHYLLSTDIPLIIDADGLYYFKKIMTKFTDRDDITITPHYKEMADLLDVTVDEVKKNPVQFAKTIADQYNITVVLKGTCTLIVNSFETFYSINGNPGLATAGTGDVLSGIIGSLIGQDYTPMVASKYGVLIHSLAGQYAADFHGEESMIATDLIHFIKDVMKYAKS